MKLFPIAPDPDAGAAGRAPQAKWNRLLSEPLLHFLVVGALVFGIYGLATRESAQATSTTQIELTKDDVRQLAITWLAQGRAVPTAEQLRSLVDQKATEEMLVREAVALGLDRNDEIIKRRLAQKMDFLAVDLAAMEEPRTAELKEWYAANSGRFALPPRLGFHHLYFSPDKRGSATRDEAAAALAIAVGKSPDAPELAAIADPFMFRSYYSDATPEQIAKEFGPDFAAEITKLSLQSWQGPIESGYGWHLVWIDSMEPARVPAFEEVEADVKSAWTDERYAEIKRTALDEMRSRYTVVLPDLNAVDLQDLQGMQAAGAEGNIFAQ